MESLFTLDSFADGCAGASGGISAITLFYPLNIIRTKLQTDDPTLGRSLLEVVKDLKRTSNVEFGNPISGFYRGWWGQIVALGCSNFVYFYSYHCLKIIVQNRYELDSIDPVSNLTVGAVAGVINVLLTTPLWAVSTRLAVQAKKGLRKGSKPYLGMIDGLTRMCRREGFWGMWKSVVPNLILVSNPTIHFFVYERVRIVMSRIAKRRGSALSSLEFFFMGAIAKTVATFLTYPLQVVQSQLRNDAKSEKGKQKYKGTFDCLVKIYQVAGFAGWFRGLFAKLWQTVLTAAFQFMTYEKLRVVVKACILSLFLRRGGRSNRRLK